MRSLKKLKAKISNAKGWIPIWDSNLYPGTYIIILFMVLIALYMVHGYDLVIGTQNKAPIPISNLSVIKLPHSPLAGWALIALALWLLIIPKNVDRLIGNKIKSSVKFIIGRTK